MFTPIDTHILTFCNCVFNVMVMCFCVLVLALRFLFYSQYFSHLLLLLSSFLFYLFSCFLSPSAFLVPSYDTAVTCQSTHPWITVIPGFSTRLPYPPVFCPSSLFATLWSALFIFQAPCSFVFVQVCILKSFSALSDVSVWQPRLLDFFRLEIVICLIVTMSQQLKKVSA